MQSQIQYSRCNMYHWVKTMKKTGLCYKKIGEVQPRWDPISSEPSVNKVMETIITGKNDSSTQVSIGNVTDEDGLMELFDQFSGLMSPMSDWLKLDNTVIITEASLQGKTTTHHSRPNNNRTNRHMGKYIGCFQESSSGNYPKYLNY